MSFRTPLSAAVFASGSGSNFQALVDVQERASWRVRLLVTDRADARALERAARAGIPGRHIPVTGRPVGEVAAETLSALREADADVIFLAGYLRLVPTQVVHDFAGRILNVHPALLPAFGGRGMYGRNVHEAVLRSGTAVTGPTVHFVDERYDEGRILAQWPVPVREGDTPESLAARVLRTEHLLYPLAAEHLCRALAEGREARPLAAPGEAFLLARDGHAKPLEALVHATFRTSATPSQTTPERT